MPRYGPTKNTCILQWIYRGCSISYRKSTFAAEGQNLSMKIASHCAQFVLILIVGSASLTAQQLVLPLWPHGTPEPPQTTAPEGYVSNPSYHSKLLVNVTVPTLTVYSPKLHSTGVAALVLPGGGYNDLAWKKEGTDACDWLNSIGVTCLLVKYRVPEHPRYPDNPADLEDAQQAMRMARAHAAEWHIDPNRIGVMGFSAGGNLAVLLCTHPDDRHVESTPAASEVNPAISARANFAILAYPAYLAVRPEQITLDPVYQPNKFTPPTFLIQAEDDKNYGKNAIVYYRALMDANIPAELHYYATGGHGFGVYPVGRPEENWTALAAAWLARIHLISAE